VNRRRSGRGDLDGLFFGFKQPARVDGELAGGCGAVPRSDPTAALFSAGGGRHGAVQPSFSAGTTQSPTRAIFTLFLLLPKTNII
jgi:hypothetical protein